VSKRFSEMTRDERKEAMRKIASEPRTKKMNCAECGASMRRLYPERTSGVWCMDCTMRAVEIPPS
jgi:hypothetical protein